MDDRLALDQQRLTQNDVLRIVAWVSRIPEARLAKAAGVSRNFMHMAMHNDRTLSPRVFDLVCEQLDVVPDRIKTFRPPRGPHGKHTGEQKQKSEASNADERRTEAPGA